MRSMQYVGLGVFLIALIGFTGCPEPVDVDQERERISEVITEFFQALEEENWELFRESVHQEWKYFSPAGRIHTLDEIMDIFEEGVSDFSVEIEDLSIRISWDGSMGWATFTSEIQHMMQEEHIEEYGLSTMVLERENDRWVIIHLHVSVRTEE